MDPPQSLFPQRNRGSPRPPAWASFFSCAGTGVSARCGPVVPHVASGIDRQPCGLSERPKISGTLYLFCPDTRSAHRFTEFYLRDAGWAPARFPQGVVYVDDKVRAGIDTKIDARIPQALPSDAKELGRVLINRHQLNRCEECLLYPQ